MWRSFAEETGVYGLNLMLPTVPRGEKVIWLLVIALFSVATVKDISGLVERYVAEKTLTTVEMKRHHDIIFDPAPSVMFYVRTSFLQLCESNLTLANQSVLREELHSFLQSYVAANRSVSQWASMNRMPEALFCFNLRLVAHVTDIELAPIDRSALQPAVVVTDAEMQQLNIAYEFYRENNVSLSDLQQLTARICCTCPAEEYRCGRAKMYAFAPIARRYASARIRMRSVV